MSKEVKKITDEQLEKVNKQQTELSELLRSLGVLDVQKNNVHQKINDLSKVCLLYTSPSPRDEL